MDWGYITGIALREQLHGVRKGKPMKPIFAQWLTILCPMPVHTKGRKTSKREKGQSSQALPQQSAIRIILT